MKAFDVIIIFFTNCKMRVYILIATIQLISSTRFLFFFSFFMKGKLMNVKEREKEKGKWRREKSLKKEGVLGLSSSSSSVEL